MQASIVLLSARQKNDTVPPSAKRAALKRVENMLVNTQLRIQACCTDWTGQKRKTLKRRLSAFFSHLLESEIRSYTASWAVDTRAANDRGNPYQDENVVMPRCSMPQRQQRLRARNKVHDCCPQRIQTFAASQSCGNRWNANLFIISSNSQFRTKKCSTTVEWMAGP